MSDDDKIQTLRTKIVALRIEEDRAKLAAHESKAKADQVEIAWNQAGAEFMEHARAHQRVIVELMQAEKDYVTELLKN